MAHLILELDSAIRPASSPESWHKVESTFDGLIRKASDIPNIAFPIISQPRPLLDGQVFSGNNCRMDIIGKHPKHDIIIASASPEYKTIGNDTMLENVLAAFETHGIRAILSFALTMNNCKKVSYAFEIEGANEFFVNGNDRHKQYINVTGAHDGTAGVQKFGSATRIVCDNTLQMALRGVKSLMDYSFYHSAKGVFDFSKLPQIIESSLLHASAYSKLAEQLGNRPLKLEEAKAIAAQMLSNGSTDISTMTVNAADAIADTFQYGKGNKGENLYDYLNGVTEYYTSGDGSGKTVSKFQKMVSSDFGNGATKKSDVLYKLQTPKGDLISDNEINALITQGNLLLKSYETNKSNKLAMA